jgi:hypothetical protein
MTSIAPFRVEVATVGTRKSRGHTPPLEVIPQCRSAYRSFRRTNKDISVAIGGALSDVQRQRLAAPVGRAHEVIHVAPARCHRRYRFRRPRKKALRDGDTPSIDVPQARRCTSARPAGILRFPVWQIRPRDGVPALSTRRRAPFSSPYYDFLANCLPFA